jgi:hypothetical protein
MGTPILAYNAGPLLVVRPRIGPGLLQGGIGLAAMLLFTAGHGLLSWYRGGQPLPAVIELSRLAPSEALAFVGKMGVVMAACGLVPYLLDWGEEWRADANGVTIYRRGVARRRHLWTEIKAVGVSRFHTTVAPQRGPRRTLNSTRRVDGHRLRELWLSKTPVPTVPPTGNSTR